MNRLGEYLTVKHGWAFKGEHFASDGELCLLTPGNFYESGGFKENSGKERYYSGKFPKEYLCKKGDLVIAMTEQAAGLLGSAAIVPEDDKYLHNQRIGLVHCSKRIDKMYAYYLFMTSSVRRQLEGSASGTKVKHTSPERIYDVLVDVPDDIGSQQAIASLLWEIDQLTSINNQINDNL
ncbi:restriction endonuclease subunit S [Rubneribacter badeniensis]|uniref:restriction endonuclease subunit S n=1 Tax=Rubneribacter badeniensis TaxID=2070688 RepID=UPI003A942E02